MASKNFPAPYPHGDLEEILPDIFVVPGSVKLPGPPLRFSRNMIVLRHEGALTLVNTVRLNDAGLTALDALGKVEHVIRIAGFHGMDDPFYKDRYGAQVWALKGQVYASGFNNIKADPKRYFSPDVEMDSATALPIPGARLIVISGVTPEGILHLERDGGVLITGDALQNWDRVDPYFNFLAGPVMRLMGFIKAHNVGPGWLKQAQPKADDLAQVLALEFDKVLPCHGAPVMSGAKAAYLPALERAVQSLR